MGRKEFTYPVGGAGDSPISTTQTEAFEVDNYDIAEGINFEPSLAGEAYPVTYDPAFTIQELILTDVGDVEMEATTVSGDTVSRFMLKSANLAMDTLSLDSVTFKDPNSTGAPIYGLMVGE